MLQAPAPTPAFSGNDGTASAAATGGLPPYAYLWSNGDTTASIQQLAPGTYTVSITDANGCTATDSAVVENLVGIAGSLELRSFELMPNPARGQFRVQIRFGQETEALVEVYAANGQRLERIEQRGRQIDLAFDPGGQAEGLYFVSVQHAQGRVTKPLLLAR